MRKRDLIVMGREQSLAAAVDMVNAGVNIDVVGSRGSGRSAFLKALQARLQEEEWTVVSVRGIASLRQHPLAALHLAGVGARTDARASGGLHETAEALKHLLRLPRSVLFLDDWDDLDEASWGVAEAVRRSSAIPIVQSRLQGLRARHTPTGLPASTFEPSYVIDMTPLRFEELERVLETYLAASIEPTTMSRLFAKSGGNVGLALSLVDASIRENRMVLRGEREWVATRDLWSSGLRAVLEAHLENLDGNARDALEIIAIVGVADVDTVRKLIDWGTLELLEERRMVAIVASGARNLVTVVPPLLVEFFRHEPLNARRTRLTELIVERLGQAASTSALLSEQTQRPASAGERGAVFVRLLHERARTRRLVTAAEWEANPSTGTASRYIRALLHSRAKETTATIEHVFASTDPGSGDLSARAEFITLHAQWLAYVNHDLGGALAELAATAPELGAWGRLLDAAAVRLQVNLADVPDDFANLLEVAEDLPTPVKLSLLETQMVVLVTVGRFTDARRVYASVEALDREHETYIPRALLGLALLGEGMYQKATEVLHQGFEEAYGYLDIDAARTFGAAAALAHVLAGDYAAVDELLDVLFAAGEPAPFPPGVQLSLLAMATLVSVRRGQVAAGERIAGEFDAINSPDGPLPAQSAAWARAQLLAFDGRAEEAARLLWETSEALWARGARFAAVVGMLSAVEIVPNVDRLTIARQHLSMLPDALALQAQAEYVTALLERDAAALSGLIERLDDLGMAGLALSAASSAASLWREVGAEAQARLAEHSEQQVRSRHGNRAIDTARFSAAAVILTEREKEVGRLAADGMSNQEIATRLVLSVRTVESHMHRIMRKLDVANRQGLRRHLEALN